METRKSFISRNACSSLLVLGVPVELSNLELNDILTNTIICEGSQLADGADYFYLDTEEKLNFVKSHYCYKDLEETTKESYTEEFVAYLEYFSLTEDQVHMRKLKRTDLPEEFYVFNFNMDNYCSKDLNLLIERYSDYKK